MSIVVREKTASRLTFSLKQDSLSHTTSPGGWVPPGGDRKKTMMDKDLI